MRRLVAGPGRAQFCQAVLTCHARGFGLDVHRPCNSGRAALFADRGDLDLEGFLAAHDPQAVAHAHGARGLGALARSAEHTSELQSLMRISNAVFCLKKKQKKKVTNLIRNEILNETIQTYMNRYTTNTSET